MTNVEFETYLSKLRIPIAQKVDELTTKTLRTMTFIFVIISEHCRDKIIFKFYLSNSDKMAVNQGVTLQGDTTIELILMLQSESAKCFKKL